MNLQCKVCGEKAAGYHFGAFTCEGCKSFFGRCCNNSNLVGDCKNDKECIIDKKNRTSCKACRLKKCLAIGMSKSGSRYGRRSNWFKQCFEDKEDQICCTAKVTERMTSSSSSVSSKNSVSALKPNTAMSQKESACRPVTSLYYNYYPFWAFTSTSFEYLDAVVDDEIGPSKNCRNDCDISDEIMNDNSGGDKIGDRQSLNRIFRLNDLTAGIPLDLSLSANDGRKSNSKDTGITNSKLLADEDNNNNINYEAAEDVTNLPLDLSVR